MKAKGLRHRSRSPRGALVVELSPAGAGACDLDVGDSGRGEALASGTNASVGP